MTADREKLVDLARELDAEWQSAELPSGSFARLRAKIDTGRRRRRLVWALSAGAALSAAAALVVVSRQLRAPDTAAGLLVDNSGGLELDTSDGVVEVTAGSGTLVEPTTRARFSARRGLELRRERRGVRVVRGTTRVSVPKQTNRPAVVLVSHGQIQVLGTAFTIRQRAAGGSVELHEGRIAFNDLQGHTRHLAPGESLQWPLPEDVAAVEPKPPEPEAEEPEVASTPEPKPVRQAKRKKRRRLVVPNRAEFAGLQDELDRLRAQEDYAGVIRKLERALKRARGTSFAEDLSYELGDVLTHHGPDRARACRQWQQHIKRFPQGRYTDLVEKARRTAGCKKR